MYLWYVAELGGPRVPLGVYTYAPPDAAAPHVKSIRLTGLLTDESVTARGLVVGWEKATELRDWIDTKIHDLIP